MKNYLMIALLICAIPAVAFGQNVSCDDCTHVVSVYMGEGGLIATAAEDAEMVTYVATCEGVTRSGEMAPDADGMVSMLLMGDMACHGDDEDNMFEIGPIMDGGWYWLTMETNSAVGGLVNKDVLMNETTMITDAGDGVTMTMGSGAVLLTETATGRTGLLPNILPVMEMDPPAANPCGAAGGGTATNPFTRVDRSCELGDGGTITLANYVNNITGATTRVMNGDSIMRPGGSGSIDVVIDLWGNGSGSIWANAGDGGTDGINFVRGNPAVAGGALRATARYTGVTYTGRLGSGPTASELAAGTANGGITLTSADNAATVNIAADAGHCSSTNNHSVTVGISAAIGATEAALVIPSVARHATTGVAGGISFNVVCPAASANQGEELVPENPFPTE